MADKILIFGVTIMMASGLLFNYQLYSLNRLLAKEYPDLWKKYGSGNKNIHVLARLQRLRTLATEYTSDAPNLCSLLKILTTIQYGFVLGAAIVAIGAVSHAI